MNNYTKGRNLGLIGTLLVHLLLVLFLVWVHFVVPEPEEESGVPIVMGLQDEALGGEKVAPYIEVDVMPTPAVPDVPKTIVVKEELITQNLEETVAIEEKKEKKKEKKEIKVKEEVVQKVKKQVEKPVTPQKTPEEIAAEKAKAEAARKERERKQMEEAARRKVAGAFGKGTQMSSKNTGTEKVKDGVSDIISPSTSSSNQSGYGTFDLGGRSLGKGGLPRPEYNVAEEGKVVVTITVNPQGRVVSTTIHKSTNTVNSVLRKSAENAAKRAQFNTIKGFDNQIGTITYYFNLK